MILKSDLLALTLLSAAVGYLLHLTYQKKVPQLGWMFVLLTVCLWVLTVVAYLGGQ